MKKVNRGKYNMLSEVESAKKMALNTPRIASHTVLSCVFVESMFPASSIHIMIFRDISQPELNFPILLL